MRICIIMAHLRLMTLSLTVIATCRQASRRPSNAARSCAKRDLERNALYCSQTLRNGTVTHPAFRRIIQIDQGVRHQFHPVVTLLDVLETEQQPLEFVLP